MERELIAAAKLGTGLRKKVVLVTGGSSGIGFAAAAAFARCGCQVVIAARDSRNHPLAPALQRLSVIGIGEGPRPVSRRCDVTDAADVRALVAWVYEIFGRLDVAVHAAGVLGWCGPLSSMPLATTLGNPVADPIRTCLGGTVACLAAEMEQWRARHLPGVVVNVAAAEGLKGCEGSALFSAAMHGIVGLTRSAALETLAGPRVRVNAVAPGAVDTPATWNLVKLPAEQAWEGPHISSKGDPSWHGNVEGFARLMRNVPRLRYLPGGALLGPYEVASAIVFLASEAASAITGAIIPVDNSSTAGTSAPITAESGFTPR